MKRLSLFLFGIIALTTSCQQQEVGDFTAAKSGISFRTAIDTRVEGNLFENGDPISVSAFTEAGVEYASNAEYTYSEGYFTSQDPIVYDKMEDVELSFLAVYPYSESFANEFTFTVQSDQSAGDNYSISDLMVAETEVTDATEPTLTFSRQLSQVVVEVVDASGAVVDDAVVSVSAMTSVAVNFSEATYVASGSASKVVMADNGNGSYKALVPAQTIASGADFVTVTLDGETTVEQLSSAFTLEAGNSYTYYVTLADNTEATYYADGEVTQWQTESAGASKPVHLIIVGDGYIEEDYAVGGAFDQNAQEAIDAFFDIEPFTTYRDYFRVSTVAAYSEERGATVLAYMPYDKQAAQDKNTVFSSELTGGYSTGISCDYDTVFEYAKKVSGVTDTELQGSTVIVMINLDVYAGTCMMEYSGRSVGMCPIGDSFYSIVQHESGGHGFGRLLDEYRYYDEEIPSSYVSSVTTWRKKDTYFAYNIDFTGSYTSTHWKDYFTRDGYSAVDLYEGAYLYYEGAWRPETISCMEDNRSYHGAPSREAIVRRIFSTSGSTFNIDNFLSLDVVKSDPTNVSGAYKVSGEECRHLGMPILVDK